MHVASEKFPVSQYIVQMLVKLTKHPAFTKTTILQIYENENNPKQTYFFHYYIVFYYLHEYKENRDSTQNASVSEENFHYKLY